MKYTLTKVATKWKSDCDVIHLPRTFGPSFLNAPRKLNASRWPCLQQHDPD